jgi:Interferon-related developmental regulator (IFRD)
LSILLVSLPVLAGSALYDDLASPLKALIKDSGNMPCKAAGVQTLGDAAYFGGASVDEIEEVMTFLMSITESDGQDVGAEDDIPTNVAALQTWGFLATRVDSIEYKDNEDLMGTFIHQIEGTIPSVLIAAGENIALLFEKSYREVSEDEEFDKDDPKITIWNGQRYIKEYDPWYRVDDLMDDLKDVSTLTSRNISKDDRKLLHSSFRDIISTVENPLRGPQYSTALDGDGNEYGSRQTLKAKGRVATIDKWWMAFRLKALQRILGGGLVTHIEENDVVEHALPLEFSRVESIGKDKKKGGRG